MSVFTFDFVIQIDQFEPSSMGPTDEMYGFLEYYDEIEDHMRILGAMNYSKSLLPEAHRGRGFNYEVSMSWFDSPQHVSQTIGEKRSVVELRTDFMGIESKNSDCAIFVFRDAESTDHDSRLGIMDIFPGRLPEEKSMDFLDWSAEFEDKTRKGGGNSEADQRCWPMAEPYESYYVTFEVEHSPEALDNPPRKRSE